jgi:hypothetical protein
LKIGNTGDFAELDEWLPAYFEFGACVGGGHPRSGALRLNQKGEHL